MDPEETANYEDNSHIVCTERLIKSLNVYVTLYIFYLNLFFFFLVLLKTLTHHLVKGLD